MDVAASIEKDIPSRITGENRVFIRAVIARAITAAVAAEREACALEGDRLALEQEATNARCPDHVRAYPAWEAYPSKFRQVSDAIRDRSNS